MSDLQLSLLAIGVVAIGGVLVYNWAQERKFKRRLEQAFGAAPEDILLRREPEPPPAPAPVDGRVEPQLQGSPADTPEIQAARPPSASGPGFDAALDYTADIEAASPIPAAALDELLSRVAECGRPTRVTGFDSHGGDWTEVAHGGRAGYLLLRAGMQLVDRSGSVNAAQLATFCDAVRSCATKVSGVASCPDTGPALATARDLDAFCARVDVAVGVNVIAGEGAAFSGGLIRTLAEAEGFRLEPDGVFHYRGERRQTLFTLDNHEPAPFLPERLKSLSTHGITLMLDVPRVEDGLGVLDRMLEIGVRLAEALGGNLVDDNRAGLTEAGVAKIREQLGAIHAAMAARGMTAGGERALRLFS